MKLEIGKRGNLQGVNKFRAAKKERLEGESSKRKERNINCVLKNGRYRKKGTKIVMFCEEEASAICPRKDHKYKRGGETFPGERGEEVSIEEGQKRQDSALSLQKGLSAMPWEGSLLKRGGGNAYADDS